MARVSSHDGSAGDPAELLDRLAAMGDLARWRVLALLEREELGVGEVARTLQVPQSTEDQYGPVMDLKDPELDLAKIAEGFGARARRADQSNYGAVLAEAMTHDGPTFIMIPDDHRYL